MRMFPCWLPSEAARRDVLASSPPDAAETFAAALAVLRSEEDEIDVYVGLGEGRSEAFRVMAVGGDVVASLIGQRIPKVGAK